MIPTPVFLISLPRSGSTWIQRELVRFDPIYSLPEPWYLLPLTYLNRVEQTFTPYSSLTYSRALKELKIRGVDTQGIFDRAIVAASKEVISSLNADCRYFLDKTPQYAHISGDLMRLFPDAKFIFLWRDPVDVATSIMSTWGGGLDTLFKYDIDFIDGLREMSIVSQSSSENVLNLTYEDFLAAPEDMIKDVMSFLDIDIETSIVRPDAIVRDMLKSELVGDQTYTGAERVKDQLSRGNRKNIIRLMNRLPEEFWSFGRYSKQDCLDKIDSRTWKLKPIHNFISWVAAFSYRHNLYGFSNLFNKRREHELGGVNKMLD